MSAAAVRNLCVDGPEGALVKGVNLSLGRGEILGLVGMSGAGKTLTASALAGLTPPPARVVGGFLHLRERRYDLTDKRQAAAIRGRGVFMIMQSASAALNPTMRISGQVMEALGPARRKRRPARERTASLLAGVGLSREVMNYYPSQLSGGMRQRVQIAVALALRPSLLICDEPTTGLDAVTQAAVLRVMAGLPRQTGCSMIFISHDLKVVASLAENIAVLDRGAVVEHGPARDVFQKPKGRAARRLVEGALD